MKDEVNKDKPVITWTVLPAKVNAGKTALFILIFGVILLLVQFAFMTPFYTILAAILIASAFIQYFIPTTYELFEDRLRIKRLFNSGEKKLSYYRRFTVDRNGIFLSPFPQEHRLDPFRGVYLLFGENREEVIDFVKRKLQSDR